MTAYNVIRAGIGRTEPDDYVLRGASWARAERSAIKQSASDRAGREYVITDRAGRTVAQYRRGKAVPA